MKKFRAIALLLVALLSMTCLFACGKSSKESYEEWYQKTVDEMEKLQDTAGSIAQDDPEGAAAFFDEFVVSLDKWIKEADEIEVPNELAEQHAIFQESLKTYRSTMDELISLLPTE